MPESRNHDHPTKPDSRLVTGSYLTRRDGGGGLFEVIAVWWERNFGLGSLHLGVALLEDAITGEHVTRPPIKLLTDYELVRPGGPVDA